MTDVHNKMLELHIAWLEDLVRTELEVARTKLCDDGFILADIALNTLLESARNQGRAR